MPIKIETDEEYHGGEGVSKTTLWTLYNKTPFHARYGARKESHAFDIGKAAHIAILEPHRLETSVMEGPEDRRGNKWKEAQDEAAATSKILLTSGDYEQALLIRDLADTVPELRLIRTGKTLVETSIYHKDEETGCLVKCRPDIYSYDYNMIVDVKNMADASPYAFQRDASRYGYFFQDAMYSDITRYGLSVDHPLFFFLVFEKSEPPMVAKYELDQSSKSEGYAAYRSALEVYAKCLESKNWPGYSENIQKVSLKKWDFRETEPGTEYDE